MENIFGKKETIIDGEHLIEIVDTQPAEGQVYYCCKNGEIGRGSYSTVFKGYSIKGDEKLPIAIKLSKYQYVHEYFKDRELGVVPAEVFMMRRIQDFAGTTKFYHYHKLSKKYFVIISERPEKCDDLFEMACDGRLPISEERARKIIVQIARVLRAMEKKKIVHRDVLDENILYDIENGEAKLIDFGMAIPFKTWRKSKNRVGTPTNWPPEYLAQNSFDPRKETTWAMGTVLYSLVNGIRPFTCVAHAMATPLFFFKDASPECEHLIKGMLHLSPKKRLSLKQVLKHPWITGEQKRSFFRLPAFVRRILGRT